MNIDHQKYQCCLFVTDPDSGFQVYLGKTKPFTFEDKYTYIAFVCSISFLNYFLA